jgi:hypothetical protein
MQCACAILSCAACPALPYFSTLSHKRHDFRAKKKVIEHKMCVFDIFSKDTRMSNFMKIRPVGAELFHADGRTDMRKLIVAFRNLANAPKTDNLYKPTSTVLVVIIRRGAVQLSRD